MPRDLSFASILSRQRDFNDRIFHDRNLDLSRLSPSERATWTKEYILHVADELHEFLRETNWKMHYRGTTADPSPSNLLEEWVDAFKFLLGLANLWDFSAEEIVDEFFRKSAVVEYKYAMAQRLGALSYARDRIVAVDIDGVLNDYPRHFVEWASERSGISRSTATLRSLREIVGPRRYFELKDEYRESGEKQNQAVRSGAKELLDGLRASGLSVVLLSKRPFWRFSRIYADTLEWLDAMGLRYDAILFHPEKHRKIVEDFPDLVAMIEDDPAVARAVRDVGTKVVLVRGEVNEGIDIPGVEVVNRPDEALAYIAVPLSARRIT